MLPEIAIAAAHGGSCGGPWSCLVGFDADLTTVLMVVTSPRNGAWFTGKWEEKVVVGGGSHRKVEEIGLVGVFACIFHSSHRKDAKVQIFWPRKDAVEPTISEV